MKVKNVRSDRRRGRRLAAAATAAAPGRLGALVVGFYEDGELRYAGRVGTGFNEAELKRLQGAARRRSRASDSPFTGRQPPKGTRFVEPVLVASVDYGEHHATTRTLRHPVYKGLRDDIDPAQVVAPEAS